MFEMHFTMFKAALCVQSMQRGVLAACISVKVTVDFCCTVPFLISIATIAHSSLSLYFCFSASLSRSLTHTHTPLLGKTQIWFLVLHCSFTLSLCQARCLACICHLWQPGHCSNQQTKHCSCQSSYHLESYIKTRLLSFYPAPLQSGAQRIPVRLWISVM